VSNRTPCEDSAVNAHGQDEPGFEPDAEEIRRLGYRVIDLVAEHLAGLPSQPVFRPFPHKRALALLDEPLPAAGIPADEILDRFAREILPYPFGNGHPRFAAWVNGPPVVLAVLAEALAAAMDPSVAGGNHAATYVEHQVLGWLRQLVGFPADAGGLLVSGGSAATLTALAVARYRATDGAVRTAGLDQGGAPLVLYASEQGHSAIVKAAEALGIGVDNVRTIGVDAAWRIDVAALDAAVRDDVGAGRRPFAVAVSAGTVNTGAIDPLSAVRELCDRHGLWMHVDAAYGGPAILTRRYRDELEPLARADSLALDAHKWLYVPYAAGAVLVRDAGLMRATFSRVASYLTQEADPGGVIWLPWFSEYGLEQTRPFRALKVWMALLLYGRAGYARAIERDCEHAELLGRLVDDDPDLELVARNLSVVCLRCRPPGVDPDGLDDLNARVLRDVQLGGEAFVSSTILRGAFVLRACFVNPRTRREHVVALARLLADRGRALADPTAPPGCGARDGGGGAG
jgi:glutamate/tyrosine decarboxylase-like PLP-dependent enzyme